MTWSIPINRLVQRAQGRVDLVVRKITFELFRDVVLRSPVDTGRFRANWNVNLGSPDYSISASTDQSSAAPQAAEALRIPVGGIAWLANGLPYARRLEEGYSGQAPQGMVRLSVQRLSDHIAKALR